MALPQEIAAVLERGGHVVTANARATRALLQAWAQKARLQGRLGWRAPALHTWSEWVATLYEQAALERGLPLLLSDLQELALWQRAQQDEARRVVSPHRLARLARDAYALVHAHGAAAALQPSWFSGTHEDAERFLQWSAAFERECARLGRVSPARCEALLAQHAEALSLPPELLLVGFDRVLPSQAALVAALNRCGVPCTVHEPHSATEDTRIVTAVDMQQEIEACALWVRAHLADGAARRIGVLTPDLAAMRAEVDRVFRRVLLPRASQRAASGAAPYEFSLGTPLATMPNMAAALALLRWLDQPLEAAEVSGLLLGGFLAADLVEARQLAAADLALRRRGLMKAEMRISALLGEGSLLPQSVRARLASAHAWLQTRRRRTAAYSQQADFAAEALRQAGWPGYRERNSELFQAEEAFRRLLAEVARLDALAEAVSWSGFVQVLQQGALARLFAAESVDAPVQVVGLSEAAGQTFDAVWVLGMTEDRWPGRGRMHPLLPVTLQRAYEMPHADDARDLLLAEQKMRRVFASAPRITWSHARSAGPVEQRPAPMLRMLDGVLAEQAEPGPQLWRQQAMERVPEALTGIAWPVEQVSGGSEVLRRQAACGFQSFARARLGADAPEGETWGLDLRSRAVLLHRALEFLWSTEPAVPGGPRLHTLADLQRAIDEDRLVDCVTDAVADALRRETNETREDGWTQRFLRLESERLRRRILEWLGEEQDRAPFRVIALEKKIDTALIGELRLRLRLDRADALEDGSTLLLDYKTGDEVSVRQWMGDRPDEPQLPLYALFGGMDRVSAVAFAQVRAGAGKTCLHPLAERPEQQLGPRFATPHGKEPRHVLTESMKAEWRAALRSLAADFVRGDARVNPKHGAQTCRHCGLFALCRVRSQEQAILLGGNDEEPAGE